MKTSIFLTAITVALPMIALPSTAQAAAIVIPTTTVPGTNGTGANVAIGTVSGGDTFSLTVSGTPYLQVNNQYGVNAAGVSTVAGSNVGVGGSNVDPFTGYVYGALIATLSGTGFTSVTKQLFATNAANGLGSSAPPTTLSLSTSLASAFGLSGQINNASINFRVDDSDYSDNSPGSFTLNAAGAVPEPASWTMMVGGFGVIGAALRRRSTRSVVSFA